MPSADKEYAYDVDQCSVQDKARLTAFREKRSEWIDWIERDAYHSIWSQIHSIMWNDAVYRCSNEARRFASEENPTASLNGAFGEFIDRGYVATQVLDICKITDRSNDNPAKGCNFTKAASRRHSPPSGPDHSREFRGVRWTAL
jgi:hypothetical protein